jgi:hypothetical protein
MREHERVFLENLEQDIVRVEQFFAQKEAQYYDSYKQSLRPLVMAHEGSGSGEGDDARGHGGQELGLNGEHPSAVPSREAGGEEANGSIVEALEVSRDKIRVLERFASLNLMAVVKICKKHDKLVRNNGQEHAAMLISPRIVASLTSMKFVSHARLNEVSQGVQAMYSRVTGSSAADMPAANGSSEQVGSKPRFISSLSQTLPVGENVIDTD